MTIHQLRNWLSSLIRANHYKAGFKKADVVVIDKSGKKHKIKNITCFKVKSDDTVKPHININLGDNID